MGKTLNEGGREVRLKALESVAEQIRRLYGDRVEITHPILKGRELDVATAALSNFGEHRDTCMGEYFFKPVPGDPDGGQYFISLITLRNDVPIQQVPELAFALSMTNFYIETGCFALDKPTELLVYRGTRTFSGDTPEEVLIRECVLKMEEAYNIASKYATPVLALAEGSMKLMEFLELLKTE